MSVKVTVLDAQKAISTHAVPKGETLVLQAQNNVNYQLTDELTGFGPQNIVAKREGDNLVILLDDGNTDPDIIIENYYNQEGSNMIIGQHENGRLYAYVPQSGQAAESVSVLAQEMSASQALGGTELTAPFWAFNPWWLAGVAGVAAVAGIAAASGGGSKGGAASAGSAVDNSAPAAPSVSELKTAANGNTLVSGTAEPGATVQIKDRAGNVIGEGKADANGRFTIETNRPVTSSDELSVIATDASGNQSANTDLNRVSSSQAQGAAPAAKPTVNGMKNLFNAEGKPSATELTVKGEPNQWIEVRDANGQVVGRALTDAQGNATITTNSPLKDGESYQVVALNPLGQAGEAANVMGDTTAPTFEQGNEVTTAPAADGKVRVEVSGTPGAKAVVRFPSGETQEVTLDDNGKATVESREQQTSGDVVVELSDTMGNKTTHTERYTDTSAPTRPTASLTHSSFDENGNPLTDSIRGKAEPNATVKLLDNQGNPVLDANGKPIETTAKSNGEYAFDNLPSLAHGQTYQVVASDADNNTSLPAKVVGDTLAPKAPIVESVRNGTNDAGAPITTISGKGQPGNVVEIKDPVTGEVKGSALVDENGDFSIPVAPMATGDRYDVVESDPAGNASKPSVANGNTDKVDPPTLVLEENTKGTLTAKGAAAPFADVFITFPNGETGKVKANEKGEYALESQTVQPAGKKADGSTYEAKANQVNPFGNSSEDAVAPYSKDNLAPSVTLDDTTYGKNDQEAPTQTVSGKTEPNATVVAKGSDGKAYPASVNPDGTFSVTVPAKDENGNPITYTVEATDINNNVGKEAVVADNDTVAPQIEVTTDESGHLVISQQPNTAVEPNADVTVTFPDGTTQTVKADEKGQFAPVTSEKPQQAGAEQAVSAKAEDDKGNSATTTTDTDVPVTAPTLVSQKPTQDDETGQQNGNELVIQAQPNTPFIITDANGEKIGEGTTDENGLQTVTTTRPLADGETFNVIAQDPNDKDNAAKQVSTEATADNVPPSQPSIKLVQNDDGTVSVLVGDNPAVNEPGATISVTFPDGTTGTATVKEDGSFDPITSALPQPYGELSVTQTDQSNQTSEPSESEYLDGQAPQAPTVSESKTLPNGNTQFSGKAEPNSVVELTDKDGNVVGTAETDEEGNFTLESDKPLTDGESYDLTATDAHENTSPAATQTVDSAVAQPAIQIKTNADGTLSVEPALGEDGLPLKGEDGQPLNEPGSTIEVTFPDGTTGTATVKEDGSFDPIVSDKPQTNGDLVANITDSKGNQNSLTQKYEDNDAPSQPTATAQNRLNEFGEPTATTVSGTAEPGSTVTLIDPETNDVLGTAKADENGNYTITTDAPLADKPYNVTATDAAGLTSEPKAVSGDNRAPAQPSVSVTQDPDGTVRVSPTLGEDGQPLKGKDGQPVNEPGSTISVTFPDGTTGTAVVNEDGSFAPIVSEKPQTSGGEVSAVATDALGNPSDPTLTKLADDEIAPNTPVVESVSNNHHDDTTTINGTAEPGSTVTLKDEDGKVIGETQAKDDGTFSLVVPTLANKAPFTLTATDENDNTSEAADIVGDTDAPATPVIESLARGVDENGQPATVISGKVEGAPKGTKVTLTDPNTNAVLGTAETDENGNFTLTTDGVLDNRFDYPLTASDDYNNISEPALAVPDTDKDGLSDEDEARAKDAVTDALVEAEKAKKAYDDALKAAQENGTISPDEAKDLADKAKAVEGAKKAVQDLIDALPQTLGDKEGDKAFQAEQQKALDAIEQPTAPSANDADDDGKTDPVEADAKKAVTDAVQAAKDAETAYNNALKAAQENGTISPDEAKDLADKAKAVEDKKAAAQTLIDNLPNTIGNESGDNEFKDAQQAALNPVTVPTNVPTANDADDDGKTDPAETDAKKAVTDALVEAEKAKKAYDDALKAAQANGTISPDEAKDLADKAKAVEDAKKAAKGLIDALPQTLGDKEGDKAFQAEQQKALDAIEQPTAPSANDADDDGKTDPAETDAKKAVTDALVEAEKAKKAYDDALKAAQANGTISPDEAKDLAKLADDVKKAKETAQGLITRLPTTIGDKEGDKAFQAEQQKALDAIEQPTAPSANDADDDGKTDPAEADAKKAVTDAVKEAKDAETAYNNALKAAQANGTISPDEAKDLADKAKAVEDKKAAAQTLINNLPNTIGNESGDKEFKDAQQAALNPVTVPTNVPTANDADDDGKTDSAETDAKKAVTDALVEAEKAKKAYDDALKAAQANGTISPDEAKDLAKLADDVKKAKETAQGLITSLPTTIGDKEGDKAFQAEQQKALDAIEQPTAPSANDADDDGKTDPAEADAKKAVTDAVQAAKDAETEYNNALKAAQANGTISPDEAKDLADKAKAVETKKAAAQTLIDNLPNTIGNESGDNEFKDAQQAALNPVTVPTNVPTANDADDDGKTDPAETDAKKAVTDALVEAEKAKKAYDDALKAAQANGTISPDEAKDLAKLADDVKKAKETAQGLITSLPTTIGDKEGDKAFQAEQQKALDAIEQPTAPSANDADDDGKTDPAEADAKKAVTDAVQAAKDAETEYNNALKAAQANGTISPDEAKDLADKAKAVETKKAAAQTLINNLPNTIGNESGDNEFKDAQQAALNPVTVPTNVPTADDADDDGITDTVETNAINTADNKVKLAETAKTEYETAKTAAEADGIISPTEAQDLATKAETLNNAINAAKTEVEGLSPAKIGAKPGDVSKEQELNARIPEAVTAPQSNDTNNNNIADETDLNNAISAYNDAKTKVDAINAKIARLTAADATDAEKALTDAERAELVREADAATTALNDAKTKLASVPTGYTSPDATKKTQAALSSDVDGLAVSAVPEANSTAGVKPDADLVTEARNKLNDAKQKVEALNQKLADGVTDENKATLTAEKQAAEQALTDAKAAIAALPTTTKPTGAADKKTLDDEAKAVTLKPMLTTPDVVDNGGAAEISLPTDAKTVTVTYTPEGGTETTATLTKGTDGTWTSNDPNVVVQGNMATIAEDKVADNSTVTANATDGQGSNSRDSGTVTQPDPTDPVTLTANQDGSVTIAPGADNVKLVVKYIDESTSVNGVEGKAGKTHNFTENSTADAATADAPYSVTLAAQTEKTVTLVKNAAGQWVEEGKTTLPSDFEVVGTDIKLKHNSVMGETTVKVTPHNAVNGATEEYTKDALLDEPTAVKSTDPVFLHRINEASEPVRKHVMGTMKDGFNRDGKLNDYAEDRLMIDPNQFDRKATPNFTVEYTNTSGQLVTLNYKLIGDAWHKVNDKGESLKLGTTDGLRSGHAVFHDIIVLPESVSKEMKVGTAARLWTKDDAKGGLWALQDTYVMKPETSFKLADDPYNAATLGNVTASVDNDSQIPTGAKWAVSYVSKAADAPVTLNLTKGENGWALDAGQAAAEQGVTVNSNGTIVFAKGSLKDSEELRSVVTVDAKAGDVSSVAVSDEAATRAPINGDNVAGIQNDWSLYDGDESGTRNYDDVLILDKALRDMRGTNVLNLGRGEDKLVIGKQGQDLSKDDTGLFNSEINMGEGDDTLVIYDKLRNSTIDMGEGNNRITLGSMHGGGATNNNGSSLIKAGSGDDLLEFVTENRNGDRHRVGIRGSARVDLGDGNNVIDTSKADTGVNFRAELKTGAGNDTFNLSNSILQPALSKPGQPAASNTDHSQVSGYIDSGAGDDLVKLGGSGSLISRTPGNNERIDSNVNTGHGVDLGKGNDTLIFDPVIPKSAGTPVGSISLNFIGTYETGEFKGGEGFDQLVMNFNTQQLNADRKFTSGRGYHIDDEFKLNLYLVEGFEVIDMSHSGKHTLHNVIELNDATRVQYNTPPTGAALAKNQGTIGNTGNTGLLVKGTAEDKVDLAAKGATLKQADTLNYEGATYDHYVFDGNHIYIQQGIQVV